MAKISKEWETRLMITWLRLTHWSARIVVIVGLGVVLKGIEMGMGWIEMGVIDRGYCIGGEGGEERVRELTIKTLEKAIAAGVEEEIVRGIANIGAKAWIEEISAQVARRAAEEAKEAVSDAMHEARIAELLVEKAEGSAVKTKWELEGSVKTKWELEAKVAAAKGEAENAKVKAWAELWAKVWAKVVEVKEILEDLERAEERAAAKGEAAKEAGVVAGNAEYFADRKAVDAQRATEVLLEILTRVEAREVEKVVEVVKARVEEIEAEARVVAKVVEVVRARVKEIEAEAEKREREGAIGE